MAKNNNNNGLILAIIFASVIISASVVFFAMQTSGGGVDKDELSVMIEDGIEAYIAGVQAEYDAQAAAQAAPSFVDVDIATLADDDAFLGDANAPVTIVEFSDFECAYCATFYSNAYQDIKSNYIETGKVKLVFRDYPLGFHDEAFPSALATECARDQAGDEAFFGMHDRIFEGQASGLSDDKLYAYAAELGLDEAKFDTCFKTEKFKEEIYADMAAGQGFGVNGTPGFIIGGEIISGAQPFSVFEAAIEKQLE